MYGWGTHRSQALCKAGDGGEHRAHPCPPVDLVGRLTQLERQAPRLTQLERQAPGLILLVFTLLLIIE